MAFTHIRSRTRRAFTIVEMLIAVAVLVVVILATAKIFSTTSAVASIGEANANLQQTASAIEKLIRADVARMTSRGYLAIQCVGVRNDINNSGSVPQAAQFGGWTQAPLLDPSRPADAIIRCDQIVFFQDGFEQTARFVGSYLMGGGTAGGNQETTASRIYIGHAVQFPALLPTSAGLRPDPVGFDYGNGSFLPPVPWAANPPPTPALEFTYWNATTSSPQKVFGAQPPARQWILARQSTLLADDGGSKYYFNTNNAYGPNSAAAIWQNKSAPGGSADNGPYLGFVPTLSLTPDPWLLNGRVDIAGSNFDDIERTARLGTGSAYLSWLPQAPNVEGDSQRNRIHNMAFGAPVPGNNGADLKGLSAWPRAEKVAPSMSRIDEILASTVLAGNCSSFEVDWTWADGTGRQAYPGGAIKTAKISATNGVPLQGFNVTQPSIGGVAQPSLGTVWLGFPDGLVPDYQKRGVTSLAGLVGASPHSDLDKAWLMPGYVYSNATGYFNQPVDGVFRISPPLIPANIEGPGVWRPMGNNMPVWEYAAVFGYNRTEAAVADGNGKLVLRDDYTPWPSALRFTIRLHDPKLTIDSGRTFQFVVELPPQTQK